MATHTNEDYQDRGYWENRYQTEDSYEWCCDVSQWSKLFSEVVANNSRILVLGCGNSSMSADLYHLGYTQIVNVDYSPSVIANMQKKYENLAGMEWHTMDMFDLNFETSTFDCVLEKCTLEVLFVKEKDPWNPSDESVKQLELLMQQISKVLRPGGYFISVSFTQPHFRLPLLRSVCPTWSIRHDVFGDAFHYFFYTCEKPVSHTA
ncbi:EEF1A lysine methyltransferase 4-like [Paramacrobiotus metropolitanus]|uniref:EEF1A lysine methyltransferase 4-like n=1 Tax=Paramacrobiotus metropolitanus TaxID=2943436 RepID=UPI0024457CDF|nr:EEF1A lysine methyltransferase 4-like [Paramacrobiotus metropolitanus]